MLTNKGFSLLEVLIGLVVLAIGILAIAGMQIVSIRANYFSGSLTQATVLAQDKIEETRNTSFENLINGTFTDTKTVSGTTFTRQWTVGSVRTGEDTTNTMKMITVTVTWTEAVGGNNVTRNVKLSTIRAQ